MQATTPRARELPVLAPLEPEPMMEKTHMGEPLDPHGRNATTRSLFRGDSAICWNMPNGDAVSIDMDSASSMHATPPPSPSDCIQILFPQPDWEEMGFSQGVRITGGPSGVVAQPSSSQGSANQSSCCWESTTLSIPAARPEVLVDEQLISPQRRLDDLPLDLLVVIMQTVSVASVMSVVNLAATSRTCYQASQQLLRDDPSVSRSVRQNQRIYQEIRAQLAKEDRGRRWPRSRLTARWVREDGSPSPLKVLCEWPEVFPYFPSVVCFAFATFVMCFSAIRLADAELISTRVMLAQLATYGVIVECIAVVCAGFFCISYVVFLRSLSVLFNLLVVLQWGIGLLGGILFFVTGMQVVYMWLCIAFTFATWMITKHCGSEFQPGYWKTNAIGSLVFSSFSVIYFLMYTPYGNHTP